MVAVKCKGCNGCRCIGAYSFQGLYLLIRITEASMDSRHDLPGDSQHIHAARVIAQSLPEAEYSLVCSCCQVLYRWVGGNEAFVIGQALFFPGSLQNDLRQ